MPSTSTDRIDGLATAVAFKAPCRVATTVNITLSGLQTIGGIALAAGDRVLVNAQTDATENGIWIVRSTAWTRAKDFDGNRDAVQGTLISVYDDAAAAATRIYRLVTDNPISIGTSSVEFEPTDLVYGDASSISFTQSGDDAVTRTIEDKGREIPSVMDYFLAAESDHTEAFQRALATGRRIICDAEDGPYTVSGSIPIASNTVLAFQGKPTINMTVDNDTRGFYFADGTENAHVLGDALINLTVNTAGTNGSFNGAFTFSTFYYTTDPTGVRYCSIKGNILVDCQGSANGKPVSIYGYTEDVEIEGVRGSGTTNIAFTCHWSGNGSSGVLPTKTWHPHRIKWRSGRSDNSGSNLNSLVLSGVGKVVVEDCGSESVEESLFLFCGDYGYTYAENITDDEACEVYVERHRVRSSNDYGLSVDMTSSGLNSSPIWVGSDHNARLTIDAFDVIVPSANTATNGIVVSGLRRFDIKNFNFVDEGSNNTEYAMELFGVSVANIDGRCLSRNGVLIRNCGSINWNAHVEMYNPAPDIAEYGISVSATSETTTVDGAVSAGDESVTLDSASIVMGPGGYLVYNVTDSSQAITAMSWSSSVVTATLTGHGYADGDQLIIAGVTPSGYNGTYGVTVTDADTFTYALASDPGAVTIQGTAAKTVDYEMDMLSSTFAGSTQTISITPAPVAIPDGATVTLIQTVKALTIGAVELSGFASGLRLTGSSTAKPRNVHANGTIFKRCGIYDVDASAVDGYRETGTLHTHGGQRTTTTSRYGINLGSNAENFIINGAHFDKNNTRQRYLINVDNSAKNGLINNCLFMSFNGSATNPAAVQKNTAVNVTIGGDNVYGAGVTTVYP